MNKYLNELQRIKGVAMASVDAQGHPQVRIIDVMAVEDDVLYFLTARGKTFFKQLIDQKQVAITTMNEHYQTIRLNGEVEHLGCDQRVLDKIFADSPPMKDVYPGG